eukprot:scaffold892_cov291-Pavlova_lutheri.AAC.3
MTVPVIFGEALDGLAGLASDSFLTVRGHLERISFIGVAAIADSLFLLLGGFFGATHAHVSPSIPATVVYGVFCEFIRIFAYGTLLCFDGEHLVLDRDRFVKVVPHAKYDRNERTSRHNGYDIHMCVFLTRRDMR